MLYFVYSNPRIPNYSEMFSIMIHLFYKLGSLTESNISDLITIVGVPRLSLY